MTTIRTSEDPSIRWAKLFAKLYYYMAKEMMDALGPEEGKKAIAAAIDKFGRARVASMKEEAAERGLDPMSKATYDVVREMPGIGWSFSPEGVTHCPLNDIWQDFGEEGKELGAIYCEIDHVLLNSFNVGLERNFCLTHGDDYCQFIYKEPME
jgi:hypothetical protein